MSLQVGTPVIFQENESAPNERGTITRVWTNGKYVTLTSDKGGRTFTRLISQVLECADRILAPAQGDAQVVDEIVGQLEQAQNERDDAQAALDLAATRWDNTRGYVADLASKALEDRDSWDIGSHSWHVHQAEVQMLEAVASFMDGQHDETVTRG